MDLPSACGWPGASPPLQARGQISLLPARPRGESHCEMEGFQAQDRHDPLPHMSLSATALNWLYGKTTHLSTHLVGELRKRQFQRGPGFQPARLSGSAPGAAELRGACYRLKGPPARRRWPGDCIRARDKTLWQSGDHVGGTKGSRGAGRGIAEPGWAAGCRAGLTARRPVARGGHGLRFRASRRKRARMTQPVEGKVRLSCRRQSRAAAAGPDRRRHQCTSGPAWCPSHCGGTGTRTSCHEQ